MSQVMTMPPTETFSRSLPFELIPTNLSGVYTSPAPPESFDGGPPMHPNSYGMGAIETSEPDDPSGVAAIWEKVFSRKWSPADRIVPHLKPQFGKTHVLRGVRKMSDGNFTSNNWGGGTIKGQWLTCFGGWTVPTVSKPPEPQGSEGGWNSSSWWGSTVPTAATTCSRPGSNNGLIAAETPPTSPGSSGSLQARLGALSTASPTTR